MSASTVSTISRREPLGLPRGVATAMTWARGLLRRAEQSLDAPAARRPVRGLFPAAVGATDQELVRLGRRHDPEEILRQAWAEMEVRRIGIQSR